MHLKLFIIAILFTGTALARENAGGYFVGDLVAIDDLHFIGKHCSYEIQDKYIRSTTFGVGVGRGVYDSEGNRVESMAVYATEYTEVVFFADCPKQQTWVYSVAKQKHWVQ